MEACIALLDIKYCDCRLRNSCIISGTSDIFSNLIALDSFLSKTPSISLGEWKISVCNIKKRSRLFFCPFSLWKTLQSVWITRKILLIQDGRQCYCQRVLSLSLSLVLTVSARTSADTRSHSLARGLLLLPTTNLSVSVRSTDSVLLRVFLRP